MDDEELVVDGCCDEGCLEDPGYVKTMRYCKALHSEKVMELENDLDNAQAAVVLQYQKMGRHLRDVKRSRKDLKKRMKEFSFLIAAEEGE